MIDVSTHRAPVGPGFGPHDLDGYEVIEQDHCIPDESVGESHHWEHSTNQIDGTNYHVQVRHARVESLTQGEKDRDV